MAHVLTRQEFYELVWSVPMNTLAERFSVSSAELKRVCTDFDIPTPATGHWSKVAHGHTPPRVELGPTENTKRIVFQEPTPADPDQINLLEALANVPPLAVPKNLRQPHKVVQNEIDWQAEQDRRQREHDRSGYSEGRWLTPIPKADPATEARRRRILDVLLKTLQSMGFAVGRAHGEYEVVRGDGRVAFTLYEKSRQEWRKRAPPRNALERLVWREKSMWLVPTGNLFLKISAARSGPAPTQWLEPQRMLDEHLREIIAAILVHHCANVLHTRRTEERQQRAAAAQQALREERAREEEDDRAFDQFAERAETWREVSLLRNFVEAIERTGVDPSEIVDGRSVEDWLAWARRRIDAADPMASGPAAAFKGLRP